MEDHHVSKKDGQTTLGSRCCMEKTSERNSGDLISPDTIVKDAIEPCGNSAVSRRDAIRILAAGVAAGTVTAAAGCEVAPYEHLAIERVSNVKPWTPILFSFPRNLPAILLDVDGSAGGVGPKQSIVAFSALCTHMGCTVQLNSSLEIHGKTKCLVCPCHTSAFDPVQLGAAIAGPATYGLPFIDLEIRGATIYATRIRQGQPVFGRPFGER